MRPLLTCKCGYTGIYGFVRGKCPSCYRKILQKVLDGKTTWTKLCRRGEVRKRSR